jgi:hypothetical protein
MSGMAAAKAWMNHYPHAMRLEPLSRFRPKCDNTGCAKSADLAM